MSMTIAENENRDLFLTADGNLAFLTDAPGDAVATALIVKSRVEAQRGEMKYATDQGLPTRQTVWDTFNPKQYEAAWRLIALATPNVTGIQSFNMFRDGNTLFYSAVITTIFGTAQVGAQ